MVVSLLRVGRNWDPCEQFLNGADVVSEASRHGRRAISPATEAVIDLDAKRFDMTGKVVNDILPDTSRFKHGALLGEAERLANEPTRHVARGQVGAFNIGYRDC